MAAEASGAGVRTFWSGTITFGLVSVPVALFAATQSRGVSLRMIARDGDPVQRRYVCSKDGKELDNEDIVRGYEISKGKFVVVTDDELEAIEPRKSRDIDLRLFVPLEDIDPKYFERAYYLAPAGGSNKAYRLLAEVMERTGRAGVATFVMRAREYVIAIIAESGLLRAETLRFADELRSPSDAGLPKQARPKPAEVKKFETAITRQSGKLAMSEFLDDYSRRLQKLVDRKERAKQNVVRLTAEQRDEQEAEEGGEVIDLVAALRRSLQPASGKPRRASGATKKPAARSRKSSKAKPASSRKAPAKKARKARA